MTTNQSLAKLKCKSEKRRSRYKGYPERIQISKVNGMFLSSGVEGGAWYNVRLMD